MGGYSGKGSKSKKIVWVGQQSSESIQSVELGIRYWNEISQKMGDKKNGLD